MSSLAADLTVPGTTVLLDESSETPNSDQFKLVPTPSTSLDDPLNWSLNRKWLSLFCMFLWVLAATFANGCLYPLYEPLSESANITLAQINSGVGYLYFFQQLFALVTAPLMVAVGKRPVFIGTCLGLCIFPFALSAVKNNSQWIGLIIVNTLFTSLVYVGPETVLSDVVSAGCRLPDVGADRSSSITSEACHSESSWRVSGAARCSHLLCPATFTHVLV